MSVQTSKLMTADELLAMPDDGFHRYELVKGELITMSPAGADHGDVALAIGASLRNFVRERGLGRTYGAETGFVIARNPDTVLAPDAAFVSEERVVKTHKFFPGPPDLAVEVISPNDLWSEVTEKVNTYLRAGTRMVIAIDPIKQLAIVKTSQATTDLTIDDTLDGGDVVPGWKLPLRELFE